MARICAVKGCSNSTVHLARWRKKKCAIHKRYFGSCYCHPPFVLHPFPTVTRNPSLRKQWIHAVNRKTRSGSTWSPSADDRICSFHFKDREPTPQNPVPTENLGCSVLPPSRKIPLKIPIIKWLGQKPPVVKEIPVPKLLPGLSASPSYRPEDDHSYFFRCQCTEGCHCLGCLMRHKETLNLKHKIDLLQSQLKLESQLKLH